MINTTRKPPTAPRLCSGGGEEAESHENQSEQQRKRRKEMKMEVKERSLFACKERRPERKEVYENFNLFGSEFQVRQNAYVPSRALIACLPLPTSIRKANSAKSFVYRRAWRTWFTHDGTWTTGIRPTTKELHLKALSLRATARSRNASQSVYHLSSRADLVYGKRDGPPRGSNSQPSDSTFKLGINPPWTVKSLTLYPIELGGLDKTILHAFYNAFKLERETSWHGSSTRSTTKPSRLDSGEEIYRSTSISSSSTSLGQKSTFKDLERVDAGTLLVGIKVQISYR
ncbi:hypothetical protein BKA70DRAFT_1224901 [Coprinopsis sp. MPI-PUGE-AT-0042]|nr:hypothetical protein BKA70DRAFT_1224901 [Coprinopsis sp. MPI-PUGE-AT-0042]